MKKINGVPLNEWITQRMMDILHPLEEAKHFKVDRKLDQAIQERLLSDDRFQKMADRVGQKIEKLHQLGLIHHDLHANNILVDSDDEPWIIDLDYMEESDSLQDKIKDTWSHIDPLLLSVRSSLPIDLERHLQTPTLTTLPSSYLDTYHKGLLHQLQVQTKKRKRKV
jgi:serine/threonine protein kinase